jgi:pectate lyase
VADAGRDVEAGSAGKGGTAGTGNDGSAGKSGAGGATADSGVDGAAGTGGTGGGTFDGGSTGCPTALVGFATMSGDNVSGTTGGGNAAPVRPTTPTELQNYASDATPRVIEISGTFAIPRLDVASNKTLVGIGKNATINGGVRVRGSSSAAVSNVIIKNLRVNGGTTDVDNDAMQIYFAHHVWIDHCEIWDGPDGNLDMSHAVNWITVSWTKFRYTTDYKRPSGETSDHRYSSLIGHSDDNAGEDDGRLKISFHHNWWAERVIERMPRVRFGEVHVFNNYFSSAGNNYCVRAGASAHLLVESNYFDGVNSPHEFNSTDDEKTASITERNNTYVGTTGNHAKGGMGAPFTSVPYAATIEPSAGISAVVQSCAGPR